MPASRSAAHRKSASTRHPRDGRCAVGRRADPGARRRPQFHDVACPRLRRRPRVLPAAAAVSIAQISIRTGIPRAAVRRCLYARQLGYVAPDEDRNFTLRPNVLALGHAYLTSAPLVTLGAAAARSRQRDHARVVLDGDPGRRRHPVRRALVVRCADHVDRSFDRQQAARILHVDGPRAAGRACEGRPGRTSEAAAPHSVHPTARSSRATSWPRQSKQRGRPDLRSSTRSSRSACGRSPFPSSMHASASPRRSTSASRRTRAWRSARWRSVSCLRCARPPASSRCCWADSRSSVASLFDDLKEDSARVLRPAARLVRSGVRPATMRSARRGAGTRSTPTPRASSARTGRVDVA